MSLFPFSRRLPVTRPLGTEGGRVNRLRFPRPLLTPWNGDGGDRDHRHPVGESSISVVIPALNEAGNIGTVLERLPAYVNEVVLIDGGSTDGTVGEAVRQRPDIIVIHENRRGKGLALRIGFRAVSGDIIVMLDADGSMNPEEIGRFVFLLAEGYHLVKGSRYLIGGGSSDLTRLRRLGNLGLRSLVNVRYGVAMTDLCYGYCAFLRSELPALQLTADGFEIEAEIVTNAMRAGLRITEVPSFEQARLSGRSNLHPLRDGERIVQLVMASHSSSRHAPRAGATVRDEIVVAGAAGTA